MYEKYGEEIGSDYADIHYLERNPELESIGEWANRVLKSKAGSYVVVTRSPKTKQFLYYRLKDEKSGSYWTQYATSALFFHSEAGAQSYAKQFKYNKPHVRRINQLGQVTKL